MSGARRQYVSLCLSWDTFSIRIGDYMFLILLYGNSIVYIPGTDAAIHRQSTALMMQQQQLAQDSSSDSSNIHASVVKPSTMTR